MRMEIVPRPNAIAKNTTNNKNKNKTRNKQSDYFYPAITMTSPVPTVT